MERIRVQVLDRPGSVVVEAKGWLIDTVIETIGVKTIRRVLSAVIITDTGDLCVRDAGFVKVDMDAYNNRGGKKWLKWIN